MLYALTLNKPSKFKCISGEGVGDKNPKLLCEKARKERAFLERGEKKGIQKCHQNALKTLQLALSCSLSKELESDLCLSPWASDQLLKPETLKQVLTKISFHMDKKKYTWGKKKK